MTMTPIQACGASPAAIHYAEMADAERGIESVLNTLTFRERETIRLRYGLSGGYFFTLVEVGRVFGITRERVRQIEAKAVRKLQNPARASRIAPHKELLCQTYRDNEDIQFGHIDGTRRAALGINGIADCLGCSPDSAKVYVSDGMPVSRDGGYHNQMAGWPCEMADWLEQRAESLGQYGWRMRRAANHAREWEREWKA